MARLKYTAYNMFDGLYNYHTLPSTIRAVIGTLTCMRMASNSTSDSECY